MKRANIMNLNIATTRIDKVYNIKKEDSCLGKGSFGIIVLAEDKTTKQQRAVKIINKEKLKRVDADLTLLSSEFNIMMQLDHPNVIKLYEVYEDPKYFYFVMEYIKGKTLFQNLTSEDYELTEGSIREIFYQLIKGIQYLHKNGIAHRDIKPENIMFLNNKSNSIKIIDFGVSKYFFSPENPKKEITLRTQAGSLYYISPETIQGAYDCRCDIWSAGVILYSMFAGEPPFYDNDPNIVVEKVVKIDYNFKESVWTKVAPELIDLIRHMLTGRDTRYTADDVLEHPWMKNPREASNYVIDSKHLKKFYLGSIFSKVFLEIIAACSSETDNDKIADVFLQIDEDGDGVISRDELLEGIRVHFKIFDKELNELILTTYKPDQKISYNNFLALVNQNHGSTNYEKRMEKAFSMIDSSKSGKVGAKDIQLAMKKMKVSEAYDDKAFMESFNQIDKDSKGYLELEDFKNLVRF